MTDITSATFDYRRQKLVVAVQVAETRGIGKTVRPFVRVRGGGEEVVFTRAQRGRVLTIRPTGKNQQELGMCKGGTVVVDVETNTIRARLPVACFGAPDRIRVGAIMGRSVTNKKTGPRYYVDDASSSRLESDRRFFKPRFVGALDRG